MKSQSFNTFNQLKSFSISYWSLNLILFDGDCSLDNSSSTRNTHWLHNLWRLVNKISLLLNKKEYGWSVSRWYVLKRECEPSCHGRFLVFSIGNQTNLKPVYFLMFHFSFCEDPLAGVYRLSSWWSKQNYFSSEQRNSLVVIVILSFVLFQISYFSLLSWNFAKKNKNA